MMVSALTINRDFVCRINPEEIFYLLFFILKPFYIRPSGTFQVADFCLVAAGFLYIFRSGMCGWFRDFRVMHCFYLFVMCVVVINTVYAVRLQDSAFMVPVLYWIFNLLFIVLSFSMLQKERLFSNIIQVFKLTICLQSVIYALHLGRWFGEIRYEGTFNDPNQFGFYMLVCALCIYMYGMHTHIFTAGSVVSLVLAIFLVIKSQSRGMTLCLVLVVLFEFLAALFCFCSKISKKVDRKFLLCCAVSIILAGVLAVSVVRLHGKSGDYTVWDRWMETVSGIQAGKGLTSNGVNAFEERGIDKLWKYSEYCIFGAGDAAYGRFDVLCNGEMHSTFPGILFCYGFVPFALVMAWCISCIRGLDVKYLAVYLALFVESCTLVHYRQPVFWFMFVLGYFMLNRKSGGENGKNEENIPSHGIHCNTGI